MNSGDAIPWRPLVKLWSDAMLRRKTQETFKAVDAEATPIVPVDDLLYSLTQRLLHSLHDSEDTSELYIIDSMHRIE